MLADAESGVLVRSFLIALVVVAPFGWWQWRRVRAKRLERAAEAAPADEPDVAATPGSETPSVEALVARISELGDETPSGEIDMIVVPSRMTMAGTPAEPAVADAIVRDALSRSGLDVVAEMDDGESRVLECRRR